MNTINAVFVITAIYDICLRAVVDVMHNRGYTYEWVEGLRNYFSEHTVVGAACIAGFVGASSYYKMELLGVSRKRVVYSSFIIVLVSVVVGIILKYSSLYPHLRRNYYDVLGRLSLLSDAASGLLVAGTYILALHGGVV